MASEEMLGGRRVVLRPIARSDYDFLYQAETSPRLGADWRFRGATPSPEDYVRTLWHNVLAQFLVCNRQNGEALGLVMAYNANFVDGWVYLGAARFDPFARSTLFVEGTCLFIQYLFDSWPFRKIYAEATERTRRQFGSHRTFVVEGQLIGHARIGDEVIDQYILACSRERWHEEGSRYVEFAKGTIGVHAPDRPDPRDG